MSGRAERRGGRRTRAVLAALLAAAALAAPLEVACAQTVAQTDDLVRLRAGEHSGYSRVVLDMPSVGDYTTATEERRLILRFPGRRFAFDTAQVFPGRRVTRVLRADGAIEVGGSTLTLALACDCAATVFALGDRRLVIDLRDAAAGAPETAAAPAIAAGGAVNSPAGDIDRPAPSLVTAPRPRAAAVASAPPAAASPPVKPSPTPAPAPPAAVASAPSAPVPRPLEADRPAEAFRELIAAATPAMAPAPLPVPAPPAPDPARDAGGIARGGDPSAAAPADETVAMARRHLLEQLARAADQGLLTYRDGGAPQTPPAAAESSKEAESQDAGARPSPDSEAVGETPAEISSETPKSAPEPPPASHLSARSVFDRDARDAAARKPPPEDCVSDRALDMADWSGPGPMAEEAAELRGRIVSEFDAVDGAAALKLAKLYIRHGFGLEAEAALRAFDDGRAPERVRREAALLADLARVVDGGAPAEGGPLAAAEGCGGAVAMWRLAAGLNAPEDALEAAAEALAAAPLEVRRLVTPRIVEALLDAGDIAGAGRMNRLLSRAGGDHGDAHRLAEARLAEAEGRIADAEAGYLALIASNAPLADEALLRFAEGLLARGTPPPPKLLADLDAAAFRQRGAPLGRRLRVVEAQLRAGDGALLPTVRGIGREIAADPAAGPELRQAARDVFRAVRADAVGAAAYARAALGHLDLVGQGPEGDLARLAAARELIALGLPNGALAALAPPLERGVAEARRVAAEANLALGAAAAALAELEGEAGEPAALLRAEALALAGGYAAAFAELGALGADSEAVRAARAAYAWRGGDWAAAAALATDAGIQSMAAYMAHRTAPVDLPPAAPLPAAAPAEGEDPDAQLRQAFLASPAASPAPALETARRLLAQSRAAREFVEETLKDG